MDRAVVGSRGLLQRVAERARLEESGLPPALSAAAIAAAEGTLGFGLHPLLSGLYTTVADGGFGPDYKLLRLLDRSTSDLGRTAVDEYVAFRQADPEDAEWFWPEGVLPVLHWGCGMYACVDCRSEDGTVLMFEPNGIEDWTQAWYVDAPDIAVWLECPSVTGPGARRAGEYNGGPWAVVVTAQPCGGSQAELSWANSTRRGSKAARRSSHGW